MFAGLMRYSEKSLSLGVSTSAPQREEPALPSHGVGGLVLDVLVIRTRVARGHSSGIIWNTRVILEYVALLHCVGTS